MNGEIRALARASRPAFPGYGAKTKRKPEAVDLVGSQIDHGAASGYQ